MMLDSRLPKKDLFGEVRPKSRGTTRQIVGDIVFAVAPVDADRQASISVPDAQGARVGRSQGRL
jgi:hypothetical protein